MSRRESRRSFYFSMLTISRCLNLIFFCHLYFHESTWNRPQLLEDLSPCNVREQLRRHIFTTMGHFRGRIKVWDVVNEALAPDGKSIIPIWYLFIEWIILILMTIFVM